MSQVETPKPQQSPVEAPQPWPLPRRRAGLVMRPAGEAGQYVVKSTGDRAYFQIGEAEHFLLEQLDGRHNAASLRAAYEQQFDEPLTNDDLNDFFNMAASMSLLALEGETESPDGKLVTTSRSAPKLRQSIFYFRRSLFDPDKLFDWLAPRIWFVWTRTFLILACWCIAFAAFVAWSNREPFISRFETVFSWQVALLFWSTLVLTMLFHEFAHGLTCKYLGGEVREIGVLMMFFTPCFYCNVSDAWLFSEKWKRVWVGLAGPFFDICLWAVATLIWRITVQDSLVNYLAWTVMAATGARTVLNFNPLMKSDGYYLLSDLTQVPNLSQFSLDRWAMTARWLLWGAPRPDRIAKGKFILFFGLASWLFIILFLGVMIPSLLQLPGTLMGILGSILSLIIFTLMMRVAFQSIFNQEVRTMIRQRSFRTKVWIVGLAAAVVALFVVPYVDRAGGMFQIRPAVRFEIRAPEAGFLRDIQLEQGSRVKPGAIIAKIHVPDLEMSVRKKQAEFNETEARLKMLEAGPRKEELSEQRARVVRYEQWCEAAKHNLVQAKEALAQDLIKLNGQIAQCEAELSFSRRTLEQAESLYKQHAYAGVQLRAEQKKVRLAEFQLEQSKAQELARKATGTIEFESELARREKELADVRSSLALLEIGTRPEEIEAEKAKLDRLREDLNYMHNMEERLVLKSPVAGVIMTTHMREKNGHYFEKGAVICVVEDDAHLEAEIALAEDDAAEIKPGQPIYLKVRALPFQTFETTVDRKAPSAILIEGQRLGTVTVYCRVSETDSALLPGMTGFARISRGTRPIGWVFAMHALKLLRTEFWW